MCGSHKFLPRHPIPFSQGHPRRRQNRERRTLPVVHALPLPSRKGASDGARRLTGCACAVHMRPLERNRVSGFAAPPGVRLRSRRVPPPPFPLPVLPRGLRLWRDHVHQHRLQWALQGTSVQESFTGPQRPVPFADPPPAALSEVLCV